MVVSVSETICCDSYTTHWLPPNLLSSLDPVKLVDYAGQPAQCQTVK